MSRFDLRASYGGFTLEARAAWSARSVALFGASGSGKSTLLEAIAGLRAEVRGTVEIAGRRIEHLPARERRVGWVPQDAALFPHLDVARNIAFGRRFARAAPGAGVARGESGAASAGPGADALAALEIEGLLGRSTQDLSGGERQRVAIARALASDPDILLLDEPLASIDRPLRARLLPYLKALPERTGVPLVLVTHDPLEVLSLVDEVLVIESGRIVAAGAPHTIFASAATFGALHAIGAENRFDVRITERSSATLGVETANGCSLSMVRVPGFPDPERVAVRAEDVLLAGEHPGVVSAQNVFAARVVALVPSGEQVTVELIGEGETWSVRVTPRAAEKLELSIGRSLYLLIKAHAIVPA